MKQFNGDFDQYSVAFKLAQGQSGLDNDRLLVDALQRGVSYQLAVMMTGVPLTNEQRDNGWKWEQWLNQAGQFYRNMVQLHNLRGGREELGFIPPAPTRPAPPPEDPNAMDVDLLKATSQHEDNALLCSVCHEKGHRTKQQDAPRRKKGNHALPRNLRKKKTPALNEETLLASYMKSNGITEERALKLLRLFYKKEAYDETSESTGDTSLETLSRATPEISQRGIFIPTTAHPMDRGNATKTIALIDSGAMICCVDLDFAQKMKWPLQKLWRPTLARNTDGTNNSGGLVRYKIRLMLLIDGKKIEQDFFATRLEKEKIILGHPWLTVHNPSINWTTGKVTLEQETSPHSSPRPTTTPQVRNVSPRNHPYGWIVPPHEAIRDTPQRRTTPDREMKEQCVTTISSSPGPTNPRNRR